MKSNLKKPQVPPVEIWSWLQLRDWTQSVDRKLDLILAAVTKQGNISQELEQKINRAWFLSKQIDLKVPDKRTTNKKE